MFIITLLKEISHLLWGKRPLVKQSLGQSVTFVITFMLTHHVVIYIIF